MPKRVLNGPIFTVTFKKGLAERNHLPLAHVINTLRELDSMIREVGIRIQRERGVENADGDFGIELLAGATGLAFAKGSIKASAAITRDIENGKEAVRSVIQTADTLEKKKPNSVNEYGDFVLKRLPTISNYQELDRTELRFQLAERGRVDSKARFSETGIKVLRTLAAAELAIEAITLHGKLRQLKDLSKEDEGRFFWGELLEDNGNTWRMKFKDSDLKKVLPLFRKQVRASGDATYFRTKNPRLDVTEIIADQDRDYVAAFDNFRATYEDVFGDRDPDEIMRDIRG